MVESSIGILPDAHSPPLFHTHLIASLSSFEFASSSLLSLLYHASFPKKKKFSVLLPLFLTNNREKLFGYTLMHFRARKYELAPATEQSQIGGRSRCYRLRAGKVAWSPSISRRFFVARQSCQSYLARGERAASGVISKTKVNKLRE